MNPSQGSKSAKSRGVRCPGVKYTGEAISKMMMTETPSSLIGSPHNAKSKRPSPMWHYAEENSACSWKSTPMTKKANPGAESFRSDVDWAPGSSWSTGASGPRVVLYSGRSFSLNIISHIFLSHQYDHQDFTYFPVSPSWPPDWSWGGSRWHLPPLRTGLAHPGSKAAVWQWRGLYTNI